MENKKTKTVGIKRISFKWKVILILELFAIVVNGSIGLLVWKTLHETVRNASQEKLVSIASSTAAAINVSKHESIRNEEDANNVEYGEISEFLRKVQNSDDSIDDIYTMRKTDLDETWEFVVDAMQTEDINNNGAIEDEEKRVEVGEEYGVSEYPQMKLAFGGPIADEEISCDKWGCWLSGYAPILDEDGNAVAIVGVDMSVEKVLGFEKEIRNISLAIMGILILLIPLVFYFTLAFLTSPMKKILKGIHGFQDDMSTRLDIRTGDEFEMIAVTFNTMAHQLELLYRDMENIVKEKTGELSSRVEEIEKRNANDEALLASIGDGLVAVDGEGNVIMMNRKAIEILGVENVDQVLHKNFCNSMELEDEKGNKVPCSKHPARRALKKGVRMSFSYVYLREDGKRIPLFMTVSPIVMGGKIIGAISVFHDISREREIDKAKSEFVSLASHQLRTPLSTIKWYAEMLSMEQVGKISSKQKKYLNAIYQSNQHMIELVNALLNVSRIEMGTFSIEPEGVNICALIRSVMAEAGPMIEEKELSINVNCDTNIPSIQADSTLMRIILQNLVSNAIKYTSQSGKITISAKVHSRQNAKKDADFLQICVADDGIGVPKHQQKHMFTKLFRADNARESVTDGNGLGLYIIKSILENSGGKINFKSEEGKGTEFIVTLPLSGMRSRKGTKRLNSYVKIKPSEIDSGNVSRKTNNNKPKKKK